MGDINSSTITTNKEFIDLLGWIKEHRCNKIQKIWCHACNVAESQFGLDFMHDLAKATGLPVKAYTGCFGIVGSGDKILMQPDGKWKCLNKK